MAYKIVTLFYAQITLGFASNMLSSAAFIGIKDGKNITFPCFLKNLFFFF